MRVFLSNFKQKKNIKKEVANFPTLSKTLAEYRTGRKGFIDMNAATSIIMPLAVEIAELHEEGRVLPSLRPDTVDIVNRKLLVNEGAFIYNGVIYPGYSAPEIYMGKTEGVVTDIYSFTALLYYLIVGVAPDNAFNRLNEPNEPLISKNLLAEIEKAESIYVPKIKLEEDPFESEIVTKETFSLPADKILDTNYIEILEKGLNLDIDKRFSSMRELIAVLEPYNTHAATIYPMLLQIDEDKIHNNLILTKKVTIREQKSLKSIIPTRKKATPTIAKKEIQKTDIEEVETPEEIVIPIVSEPIEEKVLQDIKEDTEEQENVEEIAEPEDIETEIEEITESEDIETEIEEVKEVLTEPEEEIDEVLTEPEEEIDDALTESKVEEVVETVKYTTEIAEESSNIEEEIVSSSDEKEDISQEEGFLVQFGKDTVDEEEVVEVVEAKKEVDEVIETIKSFQDMWDLLDKM